MRIRKFNEIVGFDDEETRDRLEIPFLRGELEPSGSSMTTYPSSKKLSTDTEVRKIVYRQRILERFRIDTKFIEGSKLISFFATSKSKSADIEFYVQLSFAYHDEQYHVGYIIRNREDFEDETKWVRNTNCFDDIDDVYEMVSAFVEVCKKLNIIDSGDLIPYIPGQN